MDKLTVNDLDLAGRRVLIRVDFNVPIRAARVSDETRIVAALPTIRKVLEAGASVVLMSHLGRPKGVAVQEFSLAPLVERLESHLQRAVAFAPDCVGEEAFRLASELRPGDVLLLENLRFHPGETDPRSEPDFAEKLASLGDVYINDAFGTAHRAHASMVAVAERFPRRAAGLLVSKEIEYLSGALSDPRRPFVAILGGAKVSDKIPVIDNLLGKVDALLIGGAMAYTFLKANDVRTGSSRVEDDKLSLARSLLSKARSRNVGLLLPEDHVCGREFDADTETLTTRTAEIPSGWMGLDIGPVTGQGYARKISQAGTVLWNGPMGVFEWPAFERGTMELARACARSEATTIVGGGDSAAAAAKSGLGDRLDHISTGGGASLELLQGRQLPGLAVLSDR